MFECLENTLLMLRVFVRPIVLIRNNDNFAFFCPTNQTRFQRRILFMHFTPSISIFRNECHSMITQSGSIKYFYNLYYVKLWAFRMLDFCDLVFISSVSISIAILLASSGLAYFLPVYAPFAMRLHLAKQVRHHATLTKLP